MCGERGSEEIPKLDVTTRGVWGGVKRGFDKMMKLHSSNEHKSSSWENSVRARVYIFAICLLVVQRRKRDDLSLEVLEDKQLRGEVVTNGIYLLLLSIHLSL